MKKLFLAFIVTICFTLHNASCQNKIDYGIINNIDLDGDGINDIIIKGLIDNLSAHSQDVYSFYVLSKNHDGKTVPNLVTIHSGEKFLNNFTSSRGADCELSGIRLIKDPKSKAKDWQIVIGERDFGQNYADSQKVTFTYYKLVHDSDFNQYYYEKYNSIISVKIYCDVNDAFKNELKL